MVRSGFKTGLGVVLAIVALIAVNALSDTWLTHMRWDLSEGRQYSLTAGTKELLNELSEPVSLKLYLSERLATQLPSVGVYAAQVKALLQEYVREAQGKISLEIIDPEPFSEAEDQAVGAGLVGVPINENGDALFYFGLLGVRERAEADASQTDSTRTERIAFFPPERQMYVEYDLSKLIYQLVYPSKPVVGVLTRLPMLGAAASRVPGLGAAGVSPPWVVVEQLASLFELVPVDPADDSLPEELDVLLMADSGPVSRALGYAVDQFVMGGGRLLVFTDVRKEMQTLPPGVAEPDIDGDVWEVESGLAAWGLAQAPGVVGADRTRALRIQSPVQSEGIGVGGGMARQTAAVVDYPPWVALTPSELSAQSVVTADVNRLILLSPGVIETREMEGVSVEPLIQTTRQGARLDTTLLDDENPNALLGSYPEEGEPLTLAVQLSGQLPSAFPDGPPEGVDSKGARDKAEDANVIWVADTDLLQDATWVQVQSLLGTRIAVPSAGNGAFVVNAVDYLVGNSALISVRSRAALSRPFTLLDGIRQDAEQQFRQEEQNLLGELAETEQRLAALRAEGEDSAALGSAQEAELERFLARKVEVRKNLRDVQHALRKDIERLQGLIKLVNIAGVPLLVALFGLVAIAIRHRRQRDWSAG